MAPCEVTTQSGRGSGPAAQRLDVSQVDQRWCRLEVVVGAEVEDERGVEVVDRGGVVRGGEAFGTGCQRTRRSRASSVVLQVR